MASIKVSFNIMLIILSKVHSANFTKWRNCACTW